MTMQLTINKKSYTIEAEPDTPLLWVLRDHLHLNGTKFSCGAGLCGACTVLKNGKPVRSCVMPVSQVGEDAITTIEGISPEHAVVKAWTKTDVPQCGFCQSGQILTAVAFLENTQARPTKQQIDSAITNLCRCGSYPEIREAIELASELKSQNA